VAKTHTLSRLFQALGAHDLERASQIANEIALGEEKKGHRDAARLLRGSLQPNRMTNGGLHNGDLSPGFDQMLSQSLSPQQSNLKLSELALRSALKRDLQTVIAEWRHQGALAQAGIRRRSRLLFHGPPGCGKSATAKALGNELGLPTFLVRFDGVIGAYLGQTAIHLRELFRFAERSPCVLIFDEVDALGKRRGNPQDVGELDRIVIAFMQELEHTVPAGFVVATSNLPRDLDLALWRRFDYVTEFPAPTKHELAKFVTQHAKRLRAPLQRSVAKRASHVRSYAEAERIVEAAQRDRILATATIKNGQRRTKR
jgi:SpoVK/Ycf46/Vps4 family AAA+-type ATPase